MMYIILHVSFNPFIELAQFEKEINNTINDYQLRDCKGKSDWTRESVFRLHVNNYKKKMKQKEIILKCN